MIQQSGTAVQKAGEAGDKVSADASVAWDTVDGLLDGFLAALPRIAIAVLVFLLFLLAARLVRAAVRRATAARSGGSDDERSNAGRVVGRLARFAVVFAGLLVAVSIIAPGVGVTELLGLLGAGGLAFAFALQDIFQNYVAGLLILLRKPFKVGDQIRSNEYEGTVEAIETRSTHIKTFDGRRVVIPNGEIYTTPTEVNTAFAARRTQYDVGIGYGDDLREAAGVMLASVRGVDGVLAEPAPEVMAVELAGASVNLRARWWTAPEQADVMTITGEVIAAMKEALDEAQVDMPYPTQVMLLHDQTEATDGDRTRQREGWPAGDDPPEAQTAAAALHMLAARRDGADDTSAGDGSPSPATPR
jgi:small-conductance mechanosensitive channel